MRLPQIVGVGQRERDHWRPGLQRVRNGLRLQRLRKVIDHKRPVRQLSHHVDGALDGGSRSEETSDPSQPTFVRHGSRELCGGASTHGCQDDRHFNAE